MSSGCRFREEPRRTSGSTVSSGRTTNGSAGQASVVERLARATRLERRSCARADRSTFVLLVEVVVRAG